MSRPELADAVNAALDQLYPGRRPASLYVDAHWIGKLERGEHRWPVAERRAALRHVLGAATDTGLGLYSPRRTPHTRLAFGPGPGIVLAAEPARTPTAAPLRSDVPLHGSNRYTDLAAELLAAGIEPQGVSAVRRRAFLHDTGFAMAVPALALEATRHGMRIAMSRRADGSTDEWDEIVHEHGYAYMTSAPQNLLRPLVVDMIALQHAIPSDDGATAQQLRRTGALLAALTAMTLANLGHLHESRRWWRTARRLADDSHDLKIQTWTRGREIVRAIYEQRPIGAILHLVDDFESNYPDPPRDVLPEFIGGKAQAFALAGRADDAAACLPRLHDLYADLPNTVTADRNTIFSWSEDRLRFTESFVYSFNGEYTKADEAQRRAVTLYPPTYVRGPAQIELQRALCLARMGDAIEAARHAQKVLAQLPASDHIRPIVDLGQRVLHSIAAPEQRHPEVAAYRDLLAATPQIEA